MNLDERRERAADLIQAAYGRGAALSIVQRDRRTIAQVWSPKGSLLREFDGNTEVDALRTLIGSAAFRHL